MDDLDLGATVRGFTAGQRLFGRYELKKILGRGGMGIVWLARDEKLEREVALKFLPEVMMSDKLALAELKRETRRSLELTHSHIVRIYDFVEDARTAAIAMEFIAGDTLTNARVDRPGHCFEPADLAEWVAQLCSALEYAHTKAQVVHRDLKPANLMIDARGDLKVTDFGIASSIADSVSRVSRQAGSSGTPVYMSPQQMMGEKPSVADDIYALGATLYDLLTGKPPFYSGNVILQVQSKAPPSLMERREVLGVVTTNEIAPEWEETILACLAKEPGDRPRSAGEVAARLGVGNAFMAAPRETARGVEGEKSTSNSLQVGIAQPRPRPVVLSDNGRPRGRNRPGRAHAFSLIAASVLILAGVGYYFGAHVPEQRRVNAEQRRIAYENLVKEAEQIEADLAAEREAAELRQAEAAEAAAQAAIIGRIAEIGPGVDHATKEGVEEEVRGYAAVAPALRRAAVEERWRAVSDAWDEANRPASILITTDPADAEIRMGGITRRSPAVLEDLPPGKVSFTLVKEGYHPRQVDFDLDPGQAFEAPTIPLMAIVYPVEITATTPGVHYRLEIPGGAVREGLLPAAFELPAGRYPVLYSREGYSQKEDVLTVGDVGSGRVSVDLSGSALSIISVPEAEIWSQGARLGVSPLSLADMRPGTYRFEARADGYENAERSFEVRPGEASGSLHMELKKLPNGLVRPQFAKGPTRFAVNVGVSSSSRAVVLSANYDVTSDFVVELSEPTSAGQWRRVVTEIRQMSGVAKGYAFKPGTVIDFIHSGESWGASIRRGGYENGREVSESTLAWMKPELPSVMLADAKWWPAHDTPVGGQWDVPVSDAFPFINHLYNIQGKITGRLLDLRRGDGDYWADVEYAFDIRGRQEFAGGSGNYNGTVVCRIDLATNMITSMVISGNRTGVIKAAWTQQFTVETLPSEPGNQVGQRL